MKPTRVLYIEDNLDNLVLVRRILHAAGVELLEATSALAGIETARRCLPDLILVDLNLPGMDGLHATRVLRQVPALRHIPIVALTANIMKPVLNDALAAGCSGIIAKPIDVDQFPGQVFSFLRHSRPE